jgi:hypothetical protein
MSLSLLFLLTSTVIMSSLLFHLNVSQKETSISFLSDFFFFFFGEQISLSQVYLIRCQNHMSEAIKEKERSLT